MLTILGSVLSDTAWPSVAQLTAIGTFSVPIAAIVGGLWYKIRRITSENDLKRAMIERGMSVEEIERVLASHAPGRKS